MKRIIHGLILSTLSLFFVNTVLAADYQSTSATPSTSTTVSTTADTGATQNDGQIIIWLATVNRNEIAEAKEALKKKLSPEVKNYAKMMERDHAKNLNDTLVLGKKINQKGNETDVILALKTSGKNELNKLRSLNGSQIDVQYINDAVTGHTDALTTLDQFIQQTTNPQLKDHLTATRAAVQSHLDAAKTLQSKLNATG